MRRSNIALAALSVALGSLDPRSLDQIVIVTDPFDRNPPPPPDPRPTRLLVDERDIPPANERRRSLGQHHQGSREIARRRRQLERAAIKRGES